MKSPSLIFTSFTHSHSHCHYSYTLYCSKGDSLWFACSFRQCIRAATERCSGQFKSQYHWQ